MPIKCEWSTEMEKVFITTFSGQCSIQDIKDVIPLSKQVMGDYDGMIDSIIVYTGAVFENGNYISLISYLRDNALKNTDLTIGVGLQSFVKVLNKLAYQFIPEVVPAFYVDTMQEAYDMIQKHRERGYSKVIK
jgi:hypothetical protein